MINGLNYVEYFNILKEYFLDTYDIKALKFWERVEFVYSVDNYDDEELLVSIIGVKVFIDLNNKRYFLGVFSPEDLQDFYPVSNAANSFYQGYKCCYDYLTDIDLADSEVL